MSFQRWITSLLLAILLGPALSEPAFAQRGPTNPPPRASLKIATRTAVTSAPSTSTLNTKVQDPSSSQSKKLQGSWSLRLQQRRFEDPFNQRSLTEFRVMADMTYHPIEEIYFRLRPKFSYLNGFSQTIEDEKESQSSWGVKEASIHTDVSKYWKGSLGALSQEEVHPWMLLYDQAFPSARILIQSNPENIFSAGLNAQTSIATSSSLSTQTKDFEKTPTFSSASLFLRSQSDLLETNLQLGAYEFDNLPLSVATKSSFTGNTTTPTSGTDSMFTHEYKGAFAQGKLKLKFNDRFAMGVVGNWVKNEKAPASVNQGTLGNLFAEIRVSRNNEIRPFYEFFRIEPDAAVSYYNADWLSTNRVGYLAGLDWNYKKTLKLTVSGGERDVVFTTPLQQREKTWFLRLETFDVAI